MSPSQSDASCPGDIDASGSVDGADLALLLNAWGTDGSAVPGTDIDASGSVGGADLSLLLGVWGSCAEQVPDWPTLIEWDSDPAVVTNASLREEIAATGLPWRVRDTATQIEMLLVPAGTFSMGCSASAQGPCEPDEFPVHTVTLTQPFYLGRTEVTQAKWQQAMGTNPSGYAGYPDSPSRPVERVSWTAVQGFLAATGMRLPTEAQWERACRAGTTTAFHSTPAVPDGTNQDSQLTSIAWFSLNAVDQTHAVGTKAGNGLGLHDMSGNVWEWVSDRYGSGYYAASPPQDPQGPATGAYRVMRGGGWAFYSAECRSSNREGGTPEFTSPALGFRVARDP